MRSHMPFADPKSFDLRQHVTDTTSRPADMFNLALIYHTDTDAVAALCAHATGSFRLLVGLGAVQEYASTCLVVAAEQDRDRFIDLISPCVADQVRAASEADLLEGLATARTYVPRRAAVHFVAFR